MQKSSFFSDAADFLSLVSKDYKIGIPETSDEISIVNDFKNGVVLSGSKSADLLFVTFSKTKCVNEFLESKDGAVLSSLIKNALSLSPKNCAFLLVTSDIEEVEDAHLAHIGSVKKIVFLGEEFLMNEAISETDRYTFFHTYSLQEIRNSKSVKKDFWSKFKVYFEN